MKNFLIYGANGYTGELIAREAARRGMGAIVAGRNAEKIAPLAKELDLEGRAFSLDDSKSLDEALADVEVVLHCAGPFSITSKPMADACIRNGRHYLDITGEIAVFEANAMRDGEAKRAGVMLMPGVGFDVVPSDCLALHLKNRLPAAKNLTLAFMGLGGISHGTRATMTMNVGQGGAIRRDGKIVRVPAAWQEREFDFGKSKQVCITIPWGDVSTAFYSTGIPNIEVYTFLPESAQKMLRLSRYIGKILATKPAQKYLQKQIPAGGPSEEERAKGKTFLYGEVSDGDGNKAIARQIGPEGYNTTIFASLKIVEKILAGDFKPGFQTPAKAFGENLILEIEGVSREDVE